MKDIEKVVSLESLISDMVEKATIGVRSEYEKTISELEKRSSKTINEIENKLRSILAQMAVYVCYNCHKELISGKDPVYSNFKGHKFCSHKCIDEKLDEAK